MRIIGKLKLQDFWMVHPQARTSLERWAAIVEQAEWRRFADVKKTFRSADWYSRDNRDCVIFNVGGNKYRVITAVNFKGLLAVVEAVLTHDEYSKNQWKDKL